MLRCTVLVEGFSLTPLGACSSGVGLTQVIKGYGVVKAMESFGSGSGKTSKPVSISNCGVKE